MDRLLKQFFEMVPLRHFDWGNVWNSTITSEQQQAILSKTLMSPLCIDFPPSLRYRQLFAKHILKQCDEQGAEVLDELYEVYSSLLAQKEDKNERFFKTYYLPTGTCITLKETSQVVSEGTTGLRSWPAAQYLVEWIAENTHIFTGRRLLELGSGLGLTGLAACEFSQPSSYIFSDCHDKVLKTLQENIAININRNNSQQRSISETVKPTFSSDIDKQPQRLHQDHSICDIGTWIYRTRHSIETDSEEVNQQETNGLEQQETHQDPGMRTNISMCCIDWENVHSDWLWSLNADIILAADVIYDTRIVPSLVHVLTTLLCGPNNQHRSAYIASTIRNEDTYKLFLEMVDDADIVAMEMPSSQHHLFHYDMSCPIQIMRLMQKR